MCTGANKNEENKNMRRRGDGILTSRVEGGSSLPPPPRSTRSDPDELVLSATRTRGDRSIDHCGPPPPPPPRPPPPPAPPRPPPRPPHPPYGSNPYPFPTPADPPDETHE